jgi:sporulation integral membrane protein YtvI
MLNNLQIYYDEFIVYYKKLPPNVSDTINQNINALKLKSEGLLGNVIQRMLSTVSSIPKLVVFIIVSLLAAFFINSDSYKIKRFLYKQLPKGFEKGFEGFRTDAFTAFLGYVKAVLILMAVTFIGVSFGLLIIGVDYAILMGLIVGLAEAIPIFGTGIVMVPWILWNFIIGDTFIGIGLLVIFILGVVIRQIIEPKIVGDKLGLHPLVTLLAMYIGLEIFGFIGLFVGPFSLIILKSLQKSGLIFIWKD